MARAIPFDFVLELLAEKNPITKPMFGCYGVYVDDKIVFILRYRNNPPEDDGVWVCTSSEHHSSLRGEFPALRDLSIFGPGPTNWQNLPLEADDFEESAIRACELVLQNDPRIGRIPKSKLRRKSPSRKSSTKAGAKKKSAKKSSKKAPAKKVKDKKSLRKALATSGTKKKSLSKPTAKGMTKKKPLSRKSPPKNSARSTRKK